MAYRVVGFAVAAAAALASSPAAAQQAKAAPAAKNGAATAVDGVTVTAPQRDFQSSIDRRSYSVAQDLQSTTGSIADALRNVPSVEVDVQGNVSLRGDSNVTILIDGRPSGMFKGPGRADALQQLPAERIDRVEVITNPSAADNPEGTAGVINLITKKAQGVGRTGSVRANLGSAGRYNGGLSLGYNGPKLSLSGDLNGRHDDQKMTERNARTDAAGSSRRSGVSSGGFDSLMARGSAEYDLDADDRITAELRRFQAKFTADGFDSFAASDLQGTPLRSYDRVGRSRFEHANSEAAFGWVHKFAGQDHELKLDLTLERTQTDGWRVGAFHYGGAGSGPAYEEIGNESAQDEVELKVAYTRPMRGEAKLKAGYELDLDKDAFDYSGARGAGPGSTVGDPALTNKFKHERAIHAAYATYERPFGDLTVLAGLRLEQVNTDLSQITLMRTDSADYFRAYPSLHLGYRLSDDQKLTFSYSHRVQRPQPNDLNPYRVYRDPNNFWEGNPRLEPQETHSVEAAWQYRRNQTYYLATLYYRESYKGVTEVVRDLGGGVFLTTKENLGESRSGGLELVANGRLTSKLTYNVSGAAYWNEIEASRLGFREPRSAAVYSGRANLNWQATPSDFLQVNVFGNGKRLTPQGHREPFSMVNLGYRHKFDEKLSGVVTVQDLFGSVRHRQIIDAPTLRDVTEREFLGRSIFVGFSYRLGGAGPRSQRDGFDFDNGSSGPQ